MRAVQVISKSRHEFYVLKHNEFLMIKNNVIALKEFV